MVMLYVFPRPLSKKAAAYIQRAMRRHEASVTVFCGWSEPDLKKGWAASTDEGLLIRLRSDLETVAHDAYTRWVTMHPEEA